MEIDNINTNYVPSLPPEVINPPPSSPVDDSSNEQPESISQTQVDILA